MTDIQAPIAADGTLTAERARIVAPPKVVNPLRAGLAADRNPQACAMVIFGVRRRVVTMVVWRRTESAQVGKLDRETLLAGAPQVRQQLLPGEVNARYRVQ